MLLSGYPLPAQELPIAKVFENAHAAATAGDLAAAARDYQEVIRRDPQRGSAYQNLAIIYIRQRRYDDARQTLQRGVAVDSSLPGSHTLLGLCDYQLDQPRDAVREFEAALRANSGDANARLLLAKSELRLDDAAAAIAALEPLERFATNASPRGDVPTEAQADVLLTLARAHLRLITKYADQLSKTSDRLPQYWLFSAEDAEERGNDAVAIDDYQKALQRDRNLEGVRYSIAIAEARLGHYQTATQWLHEELARDPNNSYAWWRLGQLELSGDLHAAQSDLKRALDLNPDLEPALVDYGRALLLRGDAAHALPTLEKATRLKPFDRRAYYQLARAYRAQGNQEAGRLAMARFTALSQAAEEEQQLSAEQALKATAPGNGDKEVPDFSRTNDPAPR